MSDNQSNDKTTECLIKEAFTAYGVTEDKYKLSNGASRGTLAQISNDVHGSAVTEVIKELHGKADLTIERRPGNF